MTLPYKPEPDSERRIPLAPYQTRELTAPPHLISVPEEPAQVGDYFKLLSRHGKMIVLAGLAGCLAGLLLTVVQKPSFRARTSIEIQNINGDFLNMKQAHPVADDAQGLDALMDLQTQMEVLQSSSLAASVKRAMKQRPENASLPDQVLSKIAESLKVHEIGQTRLLQIQVDAPSGVLASEFANTIVSEYIQENIRARAQMTDAAEDATRSQIVDMRRKLEASEEALQQYAARNGLHFSSDRGEAISDDGLRQVQADLLHARTDLIQKEARRQLAQAAKADSLSDVEKDPDLRELRAKLDDLRRQQAELTTVYKPTYSEVLKVQAQIDQTERDLAKARTRVVGRVMDEYKESSQTESLLSSAYQGALAKAATESQTAIQYDILKREADANLSAYQDMLAKVKELGLAAAFRTSNVRIVDPADTPKRPNSPQLPVNLALGLFSGLMLGAGYIVVAERSNPSLRHPGEAAMRLGIPELAAIPNLVGPFAEHVALPPPTQDQDADSTSLSIIKDPSSEYDVTSMDSFRTLMTSILFSGSIRGKHPKVVVVTSTAAKDGKTTVSSNLAIALARAGKKVLLIDGDLRKPGLHHKFSLQNMIGLGNLLQAGCDAADAQFAVLPTSINRLSVLPSGTFNSAPADLLFQPNLQALMNSYREHYDMIVIDSPPLMGLPDARLLGRAADGVVLVARANKTPRTAIITACQRLGLDHSRVLGVVLNDWSGKESPYPS